MANEQKMCSNCGAALTHIEGVKYKCEYCRSAYNFTFIDNVTERKLENARAERQVANFEKAKIIYKEIIETSEEPIAEAHFGYFLCDYTVLFEKNTTDEKMYPYFYSPQMKPVGDDDNYAMACKIARARDPKVYESYIDMGESIETARKTYFSICEFTEPYDIFICFKKTAKDGGNTKDMDVALDIYSHIQNEFGGKYRTFFSEISLKDIKHREYEPNIYYALHTASAMIVICSEPEYINSPWVKNEWTRFIAMKGKGSIIPVFLTPHIMSLPSPFNMLQGCKEGAYMLRDLDTALDAVLNTEDLKAARARKQKEDEERLNSIIEAKLGGVGVSSGAVVKIDNLLKTAKRELADGSFDVCKRKCDEALNLDADRVGALWLMFLAENQLTGDDALRNNLFGQNWTEFKYAKTAIECAKYPNANAEEKQQVEGMLFDWIKTCINSAKKFHSAGKFTEAKTILGIAARRVDEYGGDNRFDYYYLSMLLEIGCKTVDEIVSKSGIYKMTLFNKSLSYANTAQKSLLNALTDSASVNAKNYSEEINQKLSIINAELDAYENDIKEAGKVINLRGENLRKYIQTEPEVVEREKSSFKRERFAFLAAKTAAQEALDKHLQYTVSGRIKWQRFFLSLSSFLIVFGLLSGLFATLSLFGLVAFTDYYALFPFAFISLLSWSGSQVSLGRAWEAVEDLDWGWLLIIPVFILWIIGHPARLFHSRARFKEKLDRKSEVLSKKNTQAEENLKKLDDKISRVVKKVKEEIDVARTSIANNEKLRENIKAQLDSYRKQSNSVDLDKSVVLSEEVKKYLTNFESMLSNVKNDRDKLSKAYGFKKSATNKKQTTEVDPNVILIKDGEFV